MTRLQASHQQVAILLMSAEIVHSLPLTRGRLWRFTGHQSASEQHPSENPQRVEVSACDKHLLRSIQRAVKRNHGSICSEISQKNSKEVKSNLCQSPTVIVVLLTNDLWRHIARAPCWDAKRPLARSTLDTKTAETEVGELRNAIGAWIEDDFV